MNKAFRMIWSKAKERWVIAAEIIKGNGGPSPITIAAALVSSLVLSSTGALALPSGGQVAAGQAVISTPSATQMNINQGSNQAVINWNSFGIGKGEAVNIAQPTSQSTLLNRVLGNNPSGIFGSLNANGRVFLVNPSGVLFAPGASVNVGGLVASSLNIKDSDFMAGRYSFFKDGFAGSVVNQGNISGGFVALLGTTVENAGTIVTTKGTTGLAAGDDIILGFDPLGLMAVKVDKAAYNAQVSNSGVIEADGGTVLMSASAADALLSTVVNNSGMVRARGMVERNGEIVIEGGASGVVENSGTLDVSSVDGKGGNIKVLGEYVALTGNAIVDASGATGGGTVNIGGGFQGKDPDVANAARTYVSADASIIADATEQGDGGKIIVWSDDVTRFLGTLTARGGEQGGDGGFAEVSGKGLLDFRGAVDLKAPAGKAGTLLLDPYNLTISASSDTTMTGFDAAGDSSVLNVTTLQNALANSDVTVTTGSGGSQSGDITVANTVGWFSDYSLTLQAANNIGVSSGVSIIAAGNGNINLTATAGALTNAGSIRTFGGNLTVGANTGISGAGSYNIAGTSSFTSTNGSVTLGTTSNKFTGAVSATSGAAGSITLYNNQLTSLGAISAGTGGVTITSNGHLTGSATFDTAGAASISTASSSAGNISLNGTFTAGGNVTLSADGVGGVSIADINGSATFASVSAGGAITLGDNSTGALTFDSTSGNVISGNAAAGGQASGIVTIKGSSVTINDPIRTKGGNINLTATGGTVTAISGANITTTADDNTGTASGTVTVTASGNINLQNITTTGANNTLGVGSNAAAVTLTSTTGNINVGAITATGGAATTGATTNRNGGNAGNIVIGAASGTIYLNGDLNAIGGSFVGTATQGLGGYIELHDPVVLTANRTVSSGSTSGDISFLSTINSDSTSRSLTVTAGTGSVLFDGVIGGVAPLTSLYVNSSTRTDIEKNVTTNGAAGVNVVASSQIRLGDNDFTNGSGTVTINTLAGNGSVSLNSYYTYLDDAVTFTRGSGAISFGGYLHSNTSERNDLTFNGAGGGAISTTWDVGGSGASPDTKLGDILVSTVTDLTFPQHVSAKSLLSLNSAGRLSIGGGASSGYSQWYDGAYGFQIATTGTTNNYSNDQNININSNITLSNSSAPISVSAPNGAISFNYEADLTTAGGNITLAAGVGTLALGYNSYLTSNGGLISLSGKGVTQTDAGYTSATVNSGSGKIRIDGGGQAVTIYSGLSTTNSDTTENGVASPAILITNTLGTTLRNVTAQTGTLQVGMVGETGTVAAAQNVSGANPPDVDFQHVVLRGTSHYADQQRQ